MLRKRRGWGGGHRRSRGKISIDADKGVTRTGWHFHNNKNSSDDMFLSAQYVLLTLDPSVLARATQNITALSG